MSFQMTSSMTCVVQIADDIIHRLNSLERDANILLIIYLHVYFHFSFELIDEFHNPD